MLYVKEIFENWKQVHSKNQNTKSNQSSKQKRTAGDSTNGSGRAMKTEPEESEGPAEKPGLIFGSSDNDNDNDNEGGSAVLGDNKEENIGEQFQ